MRRLRDNWDKLLFLFFHFKILKVKIVISLLFIIFSSTFPCNLFILGGTGFEGFGWIYNPSSNPSFHQSIIPNNLNTLNPCPSSSPSINPSTNPLYQTEYKRTMNQQQSYMEFTLAFANKWKGRQMNSIGYRINTSTISIHKKIIQKLTF